MNVTVKNYAAKAVADLTITASRMATRKEFAEDSRVITRLLSVAENSIHFAVPDEARIMDDDLRGMRNIKLRLPYPKITIEYLEFGTKIVVLAEEVKLRDLIPRWSAPVPMEYLGLVDSGLDDAVMTYKFYEDEESWCVAPCCALQLSDWDANGGRNWRVLPALPGLSDALCSEYGFDEAYEKMTRMITNEARAVLELCEALTCSNVKDTIAQKSDPVLNQRRIKKGKLPIYETRILTIDVAKPKSQDKSGGSGSHASPRMHLRRGHIRRYPDKNIWVNSCVVGSKEQGVIDKSYSVL